MDRCNQVGNDARLHLWDTIAQLPINQAEGILDEQRPAGSF